MLFIEFNMGTKMQTSTATRFGVIAFVAVALITGCSNHEKTLAVFEEVTMGSGLETYHGMTHGVAWGDFDSDGLPDIYMTNHLNDPQLFHNLGKGRFADVTHLFFSPEELKGDKHGAAWADFDNDGRPDLAQLTGAVRGVGAEPKRLFHNRSDRLVDMAEALGVLNPDGRTRMPLWVDIDRDGRLDLFHGAEARFDNKTPPFVYLQQDGKFVASQLVHFAARSVPFCIVTELTGDNRPELLCRIVGKNRTAQIFDLAALPARNLELLPATAFEDVAAADFNNDGWIDLFLARKYSPGPVAFGKPLEKEIIADVRIDATNADKPAGFSFRSRGQVTFQIASAFPGDAVTPQRIQIGAQGTHPGTMVFTLTAESAGVAGTADYQPGVQAGVYVGRIGSDQWQVLVSAPRGSVGVDKDKYQQIAVKVTSSEAITELEAVGEPLKPEEAPARLFINHGGKLVEEGEKRGVNKRLEAGVNVVAGDFDNDMHLDLFVLASGDVGKQENLLLLNRGDGKFDVVRGAGGAAGSRVGVGDSVTAADFDRDGFLDLLTSTGGSMGRSLGLPSEGGGYHLYHNVGNGNHWIEIDLEGTATNRDGIGAVVRVTAGGVTQMRVQDGGVHERGQNHQRLHFGLAKNMQIEKITVHWPSGAVQELSKVAAKQILCIKEPAKSTPAVALGMKQ